MLLATRRVIIPHVIRSFKCSETAKIFAGDYSRRLPQDIQAIMRRRLRMIELAAKLEDLRVPPGNRLEALKGGREGQHSIRINDQWRICFHWNDGAAENVEIVDYH